MQLNDFDGNTGLLVKVTQEDSNGGPRLGEVGVTVLDGTGNTLHVFPGTAVKEVSADDPAFPIEELLPGGSSRDLPDLRLELVDVESAAVTDVVVVRHDMSMWNEGFEVGPFLLIPVASRDEGQKVAEDIRKNAIPNLYMDVEVDVAVLEGLPSDATYVHAWDLVREQAMSYINDFDL